LKRELTQETIRRAWAANRCLVAQGTHLPQFAAYQFSEGFST
jgi:hypothetical protein